jgi:hypothetical protein
MSVMSSGAWGPGWRGACQSIRLQFCMTLALASPVTDGHFAENRFSANVPSAATFRPRRLRGPEASESGRVYTVYFALFINVTADYYFFFFNSITLPRSGSSNPTCNM